MGALRKILLPFTWGYAIVVHLRNFLFDTGVFESRTYDVPLICVGNLRVGGTGKTPMTEYLIRLLSDSFKTAVLSRGYRRKSKGFQLADETSDVRQIGDELFQYHRKFKKIAVAADADRQNGIEKLMELVNPDAIILDDAFQHRKVKAGLNILLTSYGDLFVDDLMLPAGNLRDAVNQAKRAEIVIVTKCPDGLEESEREKIASKLRLNSAQKLFFTSIQYGTAVHNSQHSILLNDIQTPFTLVTGIANPKPLVGFLNGKGLAFDHMEFPDHHNFSDKEVANLMDKEMVITTEKDYVRLEDRLDNVYYLPIEVGFLADENLFQETILNYIKKAR